MRFSSLFTAGRRAPSRPRPAIEVLEDRSAPGTLAPDFGIPGFGALGGDALVHQTAPGDPPAPIDANPDNGEGASPSAEPARPPEAPALRAPASDRNGDLPEIVARGSQSKGGEAALLASLASSSAPAPISGGISADNGHFEKEAEDGCVVTFRHDDTHQLSGSVQGDWVESATLTLDVCTGQGFFTAEGGFTGTVLGHEGSATLRVHGEVENFLVTERGHFVFTHGEGGLAGVHAWGTFEYTVGVGGTYQGLGHFDERS